MTPFYRIRNRVRTEYDKDGIISQGDVGFEIHVLTCPTTNVQGDFVHPNPWGYSHSRAFNYSGSVERLWPDHDFAYRRVEGNLPLTVVIPPGLPSYEDVYEIAYSKLMDKLRGDLNLAVDVAEAGQTTKMVKEVANAAKYLDFWRPAMIARRYLEFLFGWKPLAASLYGALEESIRQAANKAETIQASAKRSEFVQTQREVYCGVANVRTLETATLSRFVRISMCCQPETKESMMSRWTSYDPKVIVWELLPYSFVFDWFLDVGGYLKDLETSYLNASRFMYGHISTGSKVAVNGALLPNVDHPYTVNASGFCNLSQTTFTRTPLPSYPAPRLPRLKVNLGSGQITTLGAIGLSRRA